MKTNFGFKEEHALPLNFKYLEVNKSEGKPNSSIEKDSYLKCKKYQTEFYSRKVPYKPITRML